MSSVPTPALANQRCAKIVWQTHKKCISAEQKATNINRFAPWIKREVCWKTSKGHRARREAQEMRKWKGGLRCKERIWQLSIKGKREWAGVTGSEWLRDSGATAQSSGGILSVTMAGDWVGRGLRAWIAASQTKIWSSSPRATGGGESVRVVGSRQIALLNNTSSSLHGGLGHDEATLSSKDQRERATHPLYAAICRYPAATNGATLQVSERTHRDMELHRITSSILKHEHSDSCGCLAGLLSLLNYYLFYLKHRCVRTVQWNTNKSTLFSI